VTVTVLNWNRGTDTLACLDSLSGNSYKNYDIVLLDNGSTDGSIGQLLKWFENKSGDAPCSDREVDASCRVIAETSCISILRNEVNEGYTGGMNKAIRYALSKSSPDFVFLLNNDALIDKHCLKNCLIAAETNQASIVGALVKSKDAREVLFSGGDPERELFMSVEPSIEDRLPEYWITGRVEGSGMLISAKFLYSLFEQYGYIFNPRFFVYGEDLDLGFLARASGMKMVMTKSAAIYHGLAQSTGGAGNPMQYYYTTRNRVFLANRWLPWQKRIAFHVYFPVSRLMRASQRLAQGRGWVARAIVEGLVDGYRGRSGRWERHVP